MDFTPPENQGALTGAPQAGPAPSAESFSQPAEPAEAAAAKDEENAEEPGAAKEDGAEVAGATFWEKLALLMRGDMQVWMRRILLGGGALALLWMLYRIFRPREQEGKQGRCMVEDRLPGYYDAFTRVCTAAGCPRPGGATPREYCKMLKERGYIGAEFKAMVKYLYRTRYEAAAEDPDTEKDIMKQVRELEERLRPQMTLATGLPSHD